MPNNRARSDLRALISSQGGICAYCGIEFSTKKRGRRATFEHVIPRSKGGPTSLTNGLAVCYNCNNSKGDNPPTLEQLEILARVRPSARKFKEQLRKDRDRKLKEAQESGWPKYGETK